MKNIPKFRAFERLNAAPITSGYWKELNTSIHIPEYNDFVNLLYLVKYFKGGYSLN